MSDATPTFTWPHGKRAALSVTFDDARPSQVERCIPMLDRLGVRGTFYVTPRVMEKAPDAWRAAAQRGHEIGNHTVSHPCSGNFAWSRNNALEDYTLARMEKEMRDANAIIQRVAGVTPTTFAYPCGQTIVGRGQQLQSYIPLVGRLFRAGRGYWAEAPSDPAFVDLAIVGGTAFDDVSFEQIKPMIDQTIQRGAWLSLVGHEVGPKLRFQTVGEEALEAVCKFCNDPANGIWIDTVANIADYVAAQRGAQSLAAAGAR